jgi:hypothetical protein
MRRACLVLLLACGCVDLDQPFACTDDRQCVDHGHQGSCDSPGFCSFPDTACPSGRRFAPLSGAYARQCVASDGGVGADLGPSLCPAGLLLCDGFESATVDSRWTTIATNGQLQPDDSRAFRGARSLHVHKPAITVAGTNTSDFLQAASPALTPFYMRGFVYLPSPAPQGFAIFMGSENGSGGVDFVLQKGHVGINDWFSGGGTTDSTTAMPLDRWVCVELGIVPSAGKLDLRLWLDDTEINDARLPAVSIPTGARNFQVGFGTNNPPAMPAVDYWLDEVAVDGSQIGCSR